MRQLRMVSGRATLAAATVLLLVHAGVVSAQPEPEVRPGWTFTPSFALGGAWDDNVLLAGTETATLLPDEYVTAIAPAGALHYYGRRLTLSTGYEGSFSIYREFSELNSLNQNASANAHYRWTPRLTIGAGQSFATSRETDVLEFAGVPFRRIGNRQSGTRGSVDLRLSPRTTMNAGYDFRVVDFEDEDVDLAFPGGHEHFVSGGLQHQLSPRAAVGGTYGFRRMQVVDDPNPIMLHYAAGTAEYQFTETLSVSSSLGFSRLMAVAGQESMSGLSGRAALNLRREHFTTTVSYERSMLPAFGFGGTFHNEQLAGSVQGSFSRNRAYWQAGAAWRDNDPLLTDPLVPVRPSLRSAWITSKLGYRVSPWLSVEGYFNQAYQDAQRPGGKVERTRLGFHVITSKPLRFAR